MSSLKYLTLVVLSFAAVACSSTPEQKAEVSSACGQSKQTVLAAACEVPQSSDSGWKRPSSSREYFGRWN